MPDDVKDITLQMVVRTLDDERRRLARYLEHYPETPERHASRIEKARAALADAMADLLVVDGLPPREPERPAPCSYCHNTGRAPNGRPCSMCGHGLIAAADDKTRS